TFARLSDSRNVQLRRSWPLPSEEIAGEEDDVGGALGEATHEPRIPERPVGNQDGGAIAFLREAQLLGTLNAVEHLKFQTILRDSLLSSPLDEVRNQCTVVSSDRGPHARSASFRA